MSVWIRLHLWITFWKAFLTTEKKQKLRDFPSKSHLSLWLPPSFQSYLQVGRVFSIETKPSSDPDFLDVAKQRYELQHLLNSSRFSGLSCTVLLQQTIIIQHIIQQTAIVVHSCLVLLDINTPCHKYGVVKKGHLFTHILLITENKITRKYQVKSRKRSGYNFYRIFSMPSTNSYIFTL